MRRPEQSCSLGGDFAGRLKKAVSSGDTTGVRRLLKGGVDISATYWYDGSLLHEAVASALPQMVRLLIDAKADVNARSKDGRTPLHMSCRSGQEEVVNMLLEANANVNVLTKDRRSPLHVALWRGHAGIASTLIDYNADVNHRDEDGTTALHWAAKTNLHSCVTKLLLSGANVNAADKHGRTALHEVLASSGNRQIVVALLFHGADPNIAPKIAGTSTMTLLLRQKECNVAQLAEVLLFVGYRLRREDNMCRMTLAGSVGQTAASRTFFIPILSLPAESSQYPDSIERLFNQYQNHVPSLAHVCRLRIRHVVTKCGRGLFLVDRLQQLPLPTLLRDYVAFKGESLLS